MARWRCFVDVAAPAALAFAALLLVFFCVAASSATSASSSPSSASSSSSSFSPPFSLLDVDKLAKNHANRTLGILSELGPPTRLVAYPGPSGPYLPRQGLPTIALSGSGPLFIFYAGVCQELIDKGLLVPGVSKMAGISGGAIAAAVVAAGTPPLKLLDAYDAEGGIYCNATLNEGWPMSRGGDFKGAAYDLKAFVANCVMTAQLPLEKLAKALRELLPADVAAVSATVQVIASQINPINYKQRVAWPLGPFSSREDLIAKVGASSTLPCLISGTAFTEVAGRPYVDGGYAANFNQLCVNATAANPCLSASALYYGTHGYLPQTNSHGMCDDSLPLAPPTGNSQPNPPDGFASYPKLDRRDWKLGTKKCGLAAWAEAATSFFPFIDPSPGTSISINPGKRTSMPISPCQWHSYRLGIANRTISRMIYDHGIHEARAFAAEEYGL